MGGDDTAVADLQRGGRRPAEILDRRALVKNRLTVVAEDRDFFRRDAEALAGGQSGIGVDLAEAEIHLAEIADRNRSLLGNAEDFFSDLSGEIDACVIEEFRVQVWRGAGNFCQGDVDAVGGGAGHQAEDEERFLSGRQG